MATVRDILMNADAFRRAYPHWPHAEPEKELPMTTTDLRAALIAMGVTADSPATLDAEAERLARDERRN